MKYAAAFAALAAVAFAKEIPKDPERAAELYDSGVMHERIMADKNTQWDMQSRMGVLNALDGPQFPELPFAQCKDGLAAPLDPFHSSNTSTKFRCNNVSHVV
jgi:hypothetical protein